METENWHIAEKAGCLGSQKWVIVEELDIAEEIQEKIISETVEDTANVESL